MKLRLPALPLLALAVMSLSGFGCSSLGRVERTAAVSLRHKSYLHTEDGARPEPSPKELRALLAKHSLDFTTDRQLAHWIAFVEVKAPLVPGDGFELSVVDLVENPAGRNQASVRARQAAREGLDHSLRLVEQFERAQPSTDRQN